MRELTLHEMEQVNGGPFVIPPMVITAAKFVGATAAASAIATVVSNVVDDLMDDSTSCPNPNAA